MKIYGRCENCRNSGWFIRKRSHVVGKISTKPIISTVRMCGTCNRNIKKLLKKI